MEFFAAPWPGWVTPLLIFAARLCDVSLGTIRIISLSRGLKAVAPILGFFEILVWLLAIKGIVANLDRPMAFIAYAAGFALGTLLGMLIEERLALGLLAVQVITAEDATDLMHQLSGADIGVTSFAARGIRGKVRLIYSVIKRQDLRPVLELVERFHPGAFVSISDVRMASEGVFPRHGRLWATPFARMLRKGK